METEEHPLVPLLRAASPRRLLGALALAAAVIGAIWLVRDVATPVLGALGLAYIFAPVVGALERRGLPRPLAVSALILGVVVGGGGVLALVVPALFGQIAVLGTRLPGWALLATEWLNETFHLAIPTTSGQILDRLTGTISNLGPDALGQAGRRAVDILAEGAGALTRILSLVLVPVFLFFFLKDWPRMTRAAIEILPFAMRGPIGSKLAQIDRCLSAYVRGVAIVASILAAFYSVALTMTGVPLGLLVGVLAGIGYLVPFMSTVIGVSLGVTFCLLEFSSWAQVVVVLVIFVVGNLLEGLFLTPRIVGNSLGLSPLAVILAVMIGGNLFGFLGVMLALPAAAVINVVGRDVLALWRSSALYNTGNDGPPPPSTSQEGGS